MLKIVGKGIVTIRLKNEKWFSNEKNLIQTKITWSKPYDLRYNL